MKFRIVIMFAALLGIATPAIAVGTEEVVQSSAQPVENRLESIEVAEQGGVVFVRLGFKEALENIPASFSVANPARIAFDFPATVNGLEHNTQNIEQGDLRSATVVQANGRTRLVFNLVKMVPYEAKLDGKKLIVTLQPMGVQSAVSTIGTTTVGNFSRNQSSVAEANYIHDINFRRGKEGEGRIIVQLSNADTGIDVRRQGSDLVIDFLQVSLPEHLRRRADVTDFGTPVVSMQALQQGANSRIVVTPAGPNGSWEHNAYQSDTQFVLEVKRIVEDPTRLTQGAKKQFQGEKLSLNFQNVDIRSVLQVIADFTDFNIITSDSVVGTLTLRLKDVPWDQALDIILQAKGLDLRKNGNVIWVAPSDELATREKLQLEAQAQIQDLEPLQTESFQINYHKAVDILTFLTSRDQTMLSNRGSVVVDERSNKVFVTDVPVRLDALRRLFNEIDVAPRQVLIEARIVEANKDFAREVGIRLGYGDYDKYNVGGGAKLGFGTTSMVAYDENGKIDTSDEAVLNGIINRVPKFGDIVGEAGWSGRGHMPKTPFGSLNMTLFNKSLTRFLNMELAALDSDNRGRIVSSPRVMTANQVTATIEQGTEIPYQEASSSGATSVSFKKAVLSLKVKPQITPDGRIMLSVEINKDRPELDIRYTVPAINTKNVKSEILVENGGTVVIGGIYEEEESRTVSRIPILGELPVIGNLFRSVKRVSDKRELLVFITPRIVNEALTLR